MGKLELSHFAEKPTRRTNRRSTGEGSSARFGSLVERNGNPFRVAGEDVRRNRNRNRNSDGNRRSDADGEDTRPAPAENQIHTTPQARTQSDSRFVSRHARRAVPVVDITEESSFPGLSDAAPQTTDVTTPGNGWERSGKDVVTGTKTSKVSSPAANTGLEPVRPGWVRLSADGCEYGPPSENYERILALQRRTKYVIFHEFFARSRRVTDDDYVEERYEGYAMSDDEDDDQSDDDGKNRSDGEDDQSDDDY